MYDTILSDAKDVVILNRVKRSFKCSKINQQLRIFESQLATGNVWLSRRAAATSKLDWYYFVEENHNIDRCALIEFGEPHLCGKVNKAQKYTEAIFYLIIEHYAVPNGKCQSHYPFFEAQCAPSWAPDRVYSINWKRNRVINSAYYIVSNANNTWLCNYQFMLSEQCSRERRES